VPTPSPISALLVNQPVTPFVVVIARVNALLDAAPDADLVVITHTGLDAYPNFRSLARSVPLATPVRVTAGGSAGTAPHQTPQIASHGSTAFGKTWTTGSTPNSARLTPQAEPANRKRRISVEARCPAAGTSNVADARVPGAVPNVRTPRSTAPASASSRKSSAEKVATLEKVRPQELR
jgi:hypothetical protein